MGLNGAVSGVVSRKVLPACGGLCYLCPSLRPRSRQPVKRYKKIIADIFPSTQVGDSHLPPHLLLCSEFHGPMILFTRHQLQLHSW